MRGVLIALLLLISVCQSLGLSRSPSLEFIYIIIYIYMYQDFYAYQQGVYEHVSGGLVGGHAVKIIGWGIPCGSGPTRTKRHDSLRDILWHALLTDNSDVKKEQITGGQDSSGDIYHPDFINGKPAFFDITVRNCLQPRYVVSSATSAGTAALAGEAEKDERHEEDVVSSGGLFFPLAV